MEKKNIDWGNIGFGYIPTDYRYVSNYKDGKWDDGQLTQDPNIVLNECAGVLHTAVHLHTHLIRCWDPESADRHPICRPCNWTHICNP